MQGTVDVLVIGAGSAGLAASYHLTSAGRDHVVVDRSQVGQGWRGRWDSFCLVTPNWSVRLPGYGYDGDDPDGFMLRDEVVAHLQESGRRVVLAVSRAGRIPRATADGTPRRGWSRWASSTRRSTPSRIQNSSTRRTRT